MGPQTREGW